MACDCDIIKQLAMVANLYAGMVKLVDTQDLGAVTLVKVFSGV
jgi:hypothetical protein